MAEHYLDDSVTQPFWDNSVEPRLEIESGDTVVFECPEPCGQVTPDWNDDNLANIDFAPIHALIGSVYIKGAKPGDALQVVALHGVQHIGSIRGVGDTHYCGPGARNLRGNQPSGDGNAYGSSRPTFCSSGGASPRTRAHMPVCSPCIDCCAELRLSASTS